MRLNESGPSLFGSEEVRRRVDNKVESKTLKMCFCQESVQAASLVVEEREVVGGTEADE